MSLTGDAVSEDLLVTEFQERNAAFSPDGRWFAYQSNASSVEGVYVRPFPDAETALHQISTNGGTRPLWAPDESELFLSGRGPCARRAGSDVPRFLAADADGGD